VTAVAAAFARAREEGRAALVGYLPAGFPSVEGSVEAMRTMVEAGCDVIEVGLPYSDPVMDGPTIQAAALQALEGGTRTSDVLHVVEQVAATGVATLVMTYWNPVERYGVERFAADLAAAGGAGLITPDLTPDEAGPWLDASARHGLDRVFLVAPSSTDARLRYTTEHCSGFVYATAVMGVTGARETTSDLAEPLVARTRGVTDQAAKVAAYADAVIVGSAFVRCLLDAGSDVGAARDALRSLTEELAAGVRRG
jgi:tryptophan synthase alpha chain